MDEVFALLHADRGVPGSGRVRYGAAMELYRRGLLSEAQLDAYRDASPHDGLDPALLLRQRGLEPVPLLAGFARCADVVAPVAPASHPVAERWLAPALEHAAQRAPQLARAIAAAVPHLGWTTYDAYPRTLIGEDFAAGHAFASIAGGGAPFAARSFEMGLFLIAPHVLYRDHVHKAPELYAPLTGPHGWRFAPGRQLIVKPAGEPVWNPPLQPHLTKVGPDPFLCLFAWTSHVNEPAQVIPAGDWAALEARVLTS